VYLPLGQIRLFYKPLVNTCLCHGDTRATIAFPTLKALCPTTRPTTDLCITLHIADDVVFSNLSPLFNSLDERLVGEIVKEIGDRTQPARDESVLRAWEAIELYNALWSERFIERERRAVITMPWRRTLTIRATST